MPAGSFATDKDQQNSLTFESALERVTRQIDALDEARGDIDRAQFDAEELLLELDYESDLVLRFVRENIAFQHYRGLLRGARGTLMSRSGNALDQSVLLASLLRDAGMEARILRTTLTPADSQRLLEQMRPNAALPVSDTEATDAPSAADEAAAPVDARTDLLPSNAEIAEATAEIVDLLAASGIELGDPQLMDRLAQEAADYFWIEYRLGPSEPWRQEHPVFADQNKAFSGLSHQQAINDTIPEDLLHQIRFAAFVEQRIGPKLTVHRIMDDWQKPAANLLGRSLTFFSLPSAFDEERLEDDLSATLPESGVFIPIFDGEAAPGAQAFDRGGNAFSLDALSMDQLGASGIFKTTGEKTGAAAGALQSLGAKEDEIATDFMSLTAQWVEYTLIAPGGAETRYRRMIFDRLGPLARQSSDFSKLDPDYRFNRLSTAHSFVVATGNYPQSFVLDQFLKSIVSTKPLMTRGLQNRFAKDSTISFSQALRDMTPLSPTLALYSLISQQNSTDAQLISYRPEPSVIALQGGLDEGDTGKIFYAVDIIHNARLSFSQADGRLIPAPAENIRQGVQETFFEGFAINPGGLVSARQFRMQDGLRIARQDGGAFEVLSSNSMERIKALPVGGDVKLRIGRNIEHGNVAIAPTSPLPENQIVWWQIDPHTGTTLGYLSDGTGGAAAEYLAAHLVGLTLGAAISWAVGQTDFLGCRAAGVKKGKARDCCSERRRNERWKGWALGLKFYGAYRAINNLEIDRQRSCGETSPRPPAATRPANSNPPKVRPVSNFPKSTRPGTTRGKPGNNSKRPRSSMPRPTRPATQNK